MTNTNDVPQFDTSANGDGRPLNNKAWRVRETASGTFVDDIPGSLYTNVNKPHAAILSGTLQAHHSLPVDAIANNAQFLIDVFEGDWRALRSLLNSG